MLTKICIGLLLTVALYGCGPTKESITDLREYNVDGYLAFVGVGSFDGDKFVINDYRGVKHDIPAGAVILEGPISLESFERARMRITPE